VTDEGSNSIVVIGAIASVLSLVVAAFAAAAARRSAGAAESSARHAHATENRSLVRDIVAASQGVLAERKRLEATASRLVNGYQSLVALAGHSKGGRETGYIGAVEKKKAEFPDLSDEATRLIENPHSLGGASSEDLAASLAKLQGHLVRLTTLRQEFESELASVEEQIRPLRERALGR
jgi:hypothetical protein